MNPERPYAILRAEWTEYPHGPPEPDDPHPGMPDVDRFGIGQLADALADDAEGAASGWSIEVVEVSGPHDPVECYRCGCDYHDDPETGEPLPCHNCTHPGCQGDGSNFKSYRVRGWVEVEVSALSPDEARRRGSDTIGAGDFDTDQLDIEDVTEVDPATGLEVGP